MGARRNHLMVLSVGAKGSIRTLVGHPELVQGMGSAR
jgi:hypothetical protein